MPLHAPSTPDQAAPIQTVIVEKQPPTQPPETVIILDWDDTLLCSSFLQENSFKLTSELYDLNRPILDTDADSVKLNREVSIQLKELETCVVTLLRQATAFASRTVVVTNAEHGWVQLSASKFLPGVVPFLEHVTIISARSQFEHLFPASPLKWKYFAMHSVLLSPFDGCPSGFFGRDGRAGVEKHVISLGDSHVEREAVRAVCKNVPATRTKSVKFAERPTVEQLRRQLELVNQCFGYITTHDADLDLQLTVTVNPQAPQPPATPTNTAADAALPPADQDCDMLAADAKEDNNNINTTLAAGCAKSQAETNNINSPMIEA